MYTYELFKKGNGYGFNILQDDNVIMVQEYKPQVSGFIIMTEAEAVSIAVETLARYE